MTVFHWKDNLFFGRKADGSVRVLKFDLHPADWPRADEPGTPAPTMLDLTIPAAEWASIVSSVSKSGETSESYEAARALHGA